VPYVSFVLKKIQVQGLNISCNDRSKDPSSVPHQCIHDINQNNQLFLGGKFVNLEKSALQRGLSGVGRSMLAYNDIAPFLLTSNSLVDQLKLQKCQFKKSASDLVQKSRILLTAGLIKIFPWAIEWHT
jgi:hypothetical protein